MKYIILARKNSRFFCCNKINERKNEDEKHFKERQ